MATKYIDQKVTLSDNQKEKIKKALNDNTGVSIRIDDSGEDIIALTQGQINKINKGFQEGKAVTIKLSKTQLKYNKEKVNGGFIGAIARLALPLVARAAPVIAKNLGIGALTGLASSGVSKLLGNGLYMKKGGNTYKIKPMGKGIYLGNKPSPPKALEHFADGLFLRGDDKKYYDGSGIISDIVKDIPLLNLVI